MYHEALQYAECLILSNDLFKNSWTIFLLPGQRNISMVKAEISNRARLYQGKTSSVVGNGG